MAEENNLKSLYTDGMTEFVSGNFGASVERFSDVLAQDPDHTMALTARGAANLKLNYVDKAMSDFNRVIETNPEYARAFHLRGLAKEKAGDHKGAVEDFGKAIDLDPEYGAAYFSRATLRTKMGLEDLAAEDMAMVTHLTNRNIETFANENNIWRSQQLRVESMMESDLNR